MHALIEAVNLAGGAECYIIWKLLKSCWVAFALFEYSLQALDLCIYFEKRNAKRKKY